MTYPFKVWLFTITLSPILLFIRLWSFVSDNNSEIIQGLAFLGLAILFGAGFSLPALFLFKLLHKDLRYSRLQKWQQKFIFCFVGTALIWITFILIDRKFAIGSEFNNVIWPIAYSVCLAIGAFVFNVKEGRQLVKA